MYVGAINLVAQAGIEIVSHVVTGALQRAAHRRAKRAAWEQALQRIPEDDYVDYAAYVKSQPDMLKAWQTGSWNPARGGTMADFGLINIREFGPREGVTLQVLKPGPRPDPGPTNGFSPAWPVEVLRKLPPLANPVPSVPGINAKATPASAAKTAAQSVARTSPYVWLGGAALVLLLIRGR